MTLVRTVDAVNLIYFLMVTLHQFYAGISVPDSPFNEGATIIGLSYVHWYKIPKLHSAHMRIKKGSLLCASWGFGETTLSYL